MTQEEIFKLAENLYECSNDMKKISMESANILLDMSSELVSFLEKEKLPESVKNEIENIKNEIESG